MASVAATTKETVLQAVVDRLVNQVDQLNESNCYISENGMDPPTGSHHDPVVVVAMVDGNFDDSWQAGAGQSGIHYMGTTVVAIYTPVKLDRDGRADQVVKHRDRGAFPLERQVLKALASHMLEDVAGNSLLTDHMFPLNDSIVSREPGGRLAELSVTFATHFVLDMTT